MVKHELIVIADYAEETALTVQEFCDICRISSANFNELMAYEIIRPQSGKPDNWILNISELTRVKLALRLQHDLEVNLSGVALALNLLDELKELRAYTKTLEKHYSQK